MRCRCDFRIFWIGRMPVPNIVGSHILPNIAQCWMQSGGRPSRLGKMPVHPDASTSVASCNEENAHRYAPHMR